MLWIGLTGGIASGKSTVAEIFKSLGIETVSADSLSHEAMLPNSAGARAISREFGPDVINAEGEVDRARLGAIVFRDPDARLRLEKILHPEVRKRSEEERARFEKRGDLIAVYEIPLLFEKKLEDQFDVIITVAAAPQIQIDRLMARSDLSLDAARDRIASQLSQDIKVQASDFVIWNDGDREHLKRQVEKIVSQLRR